MISLLHSLMSISTPLLLLQFPFDPARFEAKISEQLVSVAAFGDVNLGTPSRSSISLPSLALASSVSVFGSGITLAGLLLPFSSVGHSVQLGPGLGLHGSNVPWDFPQGVGQDAHATSASSQNLASFPEVNAEFLEPAASDWPLISVVPASVSENL